MVIYGQQELKCKEGEILEVKYKCRVPKPQEGSFVTPREQFLYWVKKERKRYNAWTPIFDVVEILSRYLHKRGLRQHVENLLGFGPLMEALGFYLMCPQISEGNITPFGWYAGR